MSSKISGSGPVDVDPTATPPEEESKNHKGGCNLELIMTLALAAIAAVATTFAVLVGMGVCAPFLPLAVLIAVAGVTGLGPIAKLTCYLWEKCTKKTDSSPPLETDANKKDDKPVTNGEANVSDGTRESRRGSAVGGDVNASGAPIEVEAKTPSNLQTPKREQVPSNPATPSSLVTPSSQLSGSLIDTSSDVFRTPDSGGSHDVATASTPHSTFTKRFLIRDDLDLPVFDQQGKQEIYRNATTKIDVPLAGTVESVQKAVEAMSPFEGSDGQTFSPTFKMDSTIQLTDSISKLTAEQQKSFRLVYVPTPQKPTSTGESHATS